MIKLTAVINTKNEEKNIEDCLKSVEFIDEIVVVDMESQDNTVKLAKKYTKNIFNHKDVGYVEPARSFALNKVKSGWVLLIDADERVPLQLKKQIKDIIKNPEADAYLIARKNIIFDKWIKGAGWWPDYQVRLFKKGSVSWNKEIHSQPKLKGEVKKLPAEEKLSLIHYNYQTVQQFVERLNRYTDVQSSEIQNYDKIDSDAFQLVSAFGDEFLKRMFATKGLALGAQGVSLSFLQAFYQTTLAIKKWELKEFKTNGQELEADVLSALNRFKSGLSYWIADWQIKHTTGLTQIYWKLRRYLKI
ncbi:MAG: glycosyltransferase family 2 protein [Patescibacteria group bacterium]|nr:glycosyltransferase family 2 protein [Patescibacteria group bacterium]